MFLFPKGFCADSVKEKDCCAKIYFCNVYKNMDTNYEVCKNIIITKFLILHVYKPKTLRSRISRPIILHIISTWLMNVLLRITRVVVRLWEKNIFSFSRRRKLRKKRICFVNRKNWAPDEDEDYELFLRYGWPTKDV